jgi:hypothetical protein
VERLLPNTLHTGWIIPVFWPEYLHQNQQAVIDLLKRIKRIVLSDIIFTLTYYCQLERMLAVTKWLISTFYGFYASRWANSGNEKKPFNPVLGEQFFAVWKDGGVGEGGESGGIGDFNMYCEQGMYCIRIICAFYY